MLDVFGADLAAPCNTQGETPMQVARKRQKQPAIALLTKLISS
jgi:hypothetical protein